MAGIMTKSVLCLTIAAFSVTGSLIPSARASVIETPGYLQTENGSLQTRLQTLLNREDVRNKLEALGVKPEDARERIAAMTDEELAQVRQRIDTLPAGSDALVVLGAVLLVLIVLELLGVTNVFTRF